MRWFGGQSGTPDTLRVPDGFRLLWTHPAVWVSGAWPPRHTRVTHASDSEAIVVVGPCSATDRELVNLLGREVPASTVTQWAGAYTVIQIMRDQLTIWTDPANACPIYTATQNGTLTWGSSSRALASLTGNMVDERWLATFLANPHAEVTGTSAYTDVRMLPPGYRVVVTDGHIKDLTPTWVPHRVSWPDAVERLRTTLAAAVRVRIDGATPATDLSGGMDSTTLAVLAAQTGPVTAVTVHPDGVTSGGDLDYARLTARATPNIRHLLLSLGDGHLPFAHLDALPATDEPAPSSLTWAMLSAQLQLLADTGVDCHLTGDGGDTLFLTPPVYLADLVRRGRWWRMVADAQNWARLRRTSPWPLLASALSARPPSHPAVSTTAPWLTPHAAMLTRAAPTTNSPLRLDHADRDLLARARFAARTAHVETQLADPVGITMHNPYFDPRVLEIALGVPGWRRASPRRYKPLLTAATAGILPEPVRQRAAKGAFAGDHHQGLRKNLRQVLHLADGRLAERGLITAAPLQTEINRAAAGLNVHWGHLQRVLAAELWLRSIETVPIAWTTKPAIERTAA